MKKVEYKQDEIVNVLKDINEFVVSLDQIRNVHHEFGEKAWKEEIIDYLVSRKVLDRLANIREVLQEPFSNELGDDDMSYLEREMEEVEYWTFKKYLERSAINPVVI